MKISNLIALSKLPFVIELDEIKAEIDAHRPLPKATEERIMQKLRLDWNYHSNAIEGNRLDYGETVAFLMHGITAKGKTLKDHLDIKGHNDAIQLLLSIVKDERGFSEADIRTLHKMILVEPYETDAITADGQATKKQILLGDYKKTPNSVKTRTGEMHYYASPEETPIRMAELMVWYKEAKANSEVHPLVLAAIFHHEFVAIHPFDDGNGRMARILMNLILLQKNFPVVVVKKDDRNNYYGVLSQADNDIYIPLVEYMAELLKHSLAIYLKGAKGEDIEEKDDIDKEIALFKQSLQGNINVKETKSDENIKRVLAHVVQPLVDYFVAKSEQLNELFLGNKLQVANIIDEIFPVYFSNLGELSSNAKINIFMEKLYFSYIHRSFKNTKQPFNIESDFEVFFEEMNFSFLIRNKSLFITKLYHENWKPNEMEDFVNAIMKETMREIQEKLKEK
jgi:Fic family protein